MAKSRVGMQKNFSAIFEGVWIPPKTRRRPFAAPVQKRQIQKSVIEHIISQMKCSKGFECYKSGFRNLCGARIIEGTKLIECLPENQQACEFRAIFPVVSEPVLSAVEGVERMEMAFCQCQLRCYIAKNLPALQPSASPRGEHK